MSYTSVCMTGLFFIYGYDVISAAKYERVPKVLQVSLNINIVLAVIAGTAAWLFPSMVFGIFAMDMGVFGFWYGHAIAGFTPFWGGGICFLSGKWKTQKYIIRKKERSF